MFLPGFGPSRADRNESGANQGGFRGRWPQPADVFKPRTKLNGEKGRIGPIAQVIRESVSGADLYVPISKGGADVLI